MYYKTRENAHFLDHSMNVIQNPRKCSFLDPSIYEVTLYEIVQGGDFDKSREWFRSLVASLAQPQQYGNQGTSDLFQIYAVIVVPLVL